MGVGVGGVGVGVVGVGGGGWGVGVGGLIQFNSIQAFIDAAYMHGQRRLTISSKSKSTFPVSVNQGQDHKPG